MRTASRGVGLRIARRRLALGWTRRQLAQRLDMRPGELGQYENGAVEPSVDALRRIGKILGVPADFLLGGEGELASVAGDGGTFRRPARTLDSAPFVEILDTLLGPVETPGGGGRRATTLAERIALCRAERGWSRARLAERLGLSLHQLTRYEDGGTEPEEEVFLRGTQLLEPADSRERAPAEPPACLRCADKGAEADEPCSEAYDRIFCGLESRAAEAYERFAREDERAWELLGLADDERSALLASCGERFASTGVALRLVRESEAQSDLDVERAERLAMDALTVLSKLERLPLQCDAPPVLQREIGVRAWCSLAEIARRRSDLAGAETCLDRAAAGLGEVEVDVRALYCRTLGQTRADRGRTDEALALFGRAGELLRQVGEERDRGKVLERAGWLCLRELADPLSAIELFQDASASFRKSQAPAAAGATQLAIAWALHQAGLPEWVPQALGLARAQLGARPAGDPERVRLEWLAAWLETRLVTASRPAASACGAAPAESAEAAEAAAERELPGSPVRH